MLGLRKDKDALTKKKVHLDLLPADKVHVLDDDPVELLPSARRLWNGEAIHAFKMYLQGTYTVCLCGKTKSGL